MTREERKKLRDERAADLVALAARYRAMAPEQRVDLACRSDLTENEQLALAAFADDEAVADALLSNPELSTSAEGLVEAMQAEHRRRTSSWWKRSFIR